MTLEVPQKIDDEASAWAARVDSGTLSEDEERALTLWLDADERHLGAYAKALAVCALTEKAQALGTHFNPASFADDRVESERLSSVVRRTAAPKPLGRRMVLMGGIGAAAAACFIVVNRVVSHGGRVFRTKMGETRVVPLKDGSVVTLNTASVVRVEYTPERRGVHLLEGEVLFDVAKDPKLPFIVFVNDTEVRAVGTSFTVRRLPQQPVQILVREGIVELRRKDASLAPVVRLVANDHAFAPVDAPISVESVAPAEIDRALTWRVGRLTFEGETLRQAAEMFGRYSDTHIVIDDPAIAEKTITGMFVANDPVRFAEAVAIGLHLHVKVGDGQVQLSN